MKKKFDREYIVIFIACCIIVGSIYLKRGIYNASFDQYLYSLLKSAGTGGVSSFSVAFIYSFLLVIFFCFIFIAPICNIKIKEHNIHLIKNSRRYSRILLAFAIICFGFCVKFFDFSFNNLLNSDLFMKYYVSSDDVDITFPDKKKNLIYIIMESTEVSNLSKENGGLYDVSLMPNLEKIALDNINFSNSELLGGAGSVYGTSWTVASMISQTSGVPLKLSVDDYNTNSTKFSNINILGDILYDNGYDNYLMMGSESIFGGRKNYFENHHYEISDYQTALNEGKIPEDYYEWWGFEDKKLFAFAKEKITDLGSSGKPFNFTLLTADTHFTDGYLDSSCPEIFESHYANSFYCSDRMVSDFIRWIENQEFYEDTVIIITGDHPTMQKGFYEEDDGYDRTIFNTFINTEIENVNNKNRAFSTLDMFPTTLGALGVKIEGNRLGLGTNLFSDRKTIPEEIGFDDFNKELKKYSSYYYKNIRGEK